MRKKSSSQNRCQGSWRGMTQTCPQRIHMGKTLNKYKLRISSCKRNIDYLNEMNMNQFLGTHDKLPSEKDHFDNVVGILQQILFLACKQILGSWKTTCHFIGFTWVKKGSCFPAVNDFCWWKFWEKIKNSLKWVVFFVLQNTAKILPTNRQNSRNVTWHWTRGRDKFNGWLVILGRLLSNGWRCCVIDFFRQIPFNSVQACGFKV